jgi:hypothetical protein
MQPGWICVLSTSILVGCLVDHKADFPLPDLASVTRIEVRATNRDSTYSIHDPGRISGITAMLSRHTAGWHDSWNTQPAGDVSAFLYRDTSLVAVVWVGPGFLAARGNGPRVLLDIDLDDEHRIRQLLAPPTDTGLERSAET